MWKKTFKIHAFGKVVLFSIKSVVHEFQHFGIWETSPYSWVFALFALWFLWNYKRLIIYVSRNVPVFPNIECFPSIFEIFVTSSKTQKNIPFSECYSISSYWLVCIRSTVFLRKTLKKTRFVILFWISIQRDFHIIYRFGA